MHPLFQMPYICIAHHTYLIFQFQPRISIGFFFFLKEINHLLFYNHDCNFCKDVSRVIDKKKHAVFRIGCNLFPVFLFFPFCSIFISEYLGFFNVLKICSDRTSIELSKLSTTPPPFVSELLMCMCSSIDNCLHGAVYCSVLKYLVL